MRAFAILITLILVGAAAYAAGGGGGFGNETINFSYDNSGEVVSVTRTGIVGGNTINVVTNYTYDKAKNRTNTNTSGVH